MSYNRLPVFNSKNYYKTHQKNLISKKSSGLGFFILSYALSMLAIHELLLIMMCILCGFNNELLDTFSPPNYYIQIFSSVASAFFPALIYIALSKSSLADTVSAKFVKPSILIPVIFMGMAVAMVANTASDIVSENISMFGLENSIDFSYSVDSPEEFILYAIAVAVVPAFAEEFAFRGIIMGTLRKFGDVFAIIASAAVFGAMHGNIVQIPFAFILGLFFAYVDCKTNSIIPSIIIHFINNFYAVLMDVLNTSGVISDRKFLILYMIIVVVFCALGLVSFFVIKRKNSEFFKISSDICNDITLKEKMKCFFINPGMILTLSIFLIETVLYLGFIE